MPSSPRNSADDMKVARCLAAPSDSVPARFFGAVLDMNWLVRGLGVAQVCILLALLPITADAEGGGVDTHEPETAGNEVEVIEVVGEARRTLEAAQILQRQDAAVVSDTISAQLIKKSPDSNAAEIVQRIPAVTVSGDRFLVVRGLGDRYSSAILNGSRLPSTDPDKRVISLDLFPAEFISALNLVKGYTPDLPGDFAGGLVDIELTEAPPELSYSLGVATSFNTQTTFEDFDTYKGSDADYFGFGADFRKLPKSIPGQKIDNASSAQQRAFAGAFRNIWDVDSMTAPPNLDVNFSVGDTFGPLGLSLAARYKNEYKFRGNEILGGFQNVQLFESGAETRFAYDRSRFETNLGAVAIASYELAPEHKLAARGFLNRSSFDEVLDGSGVDPLFDPDITQFQTQLQYREDQLGFGQFTGQHQFEYVDVDWRTAISQTTRDEPDTRQYSYSERDAPSPPALNLNTRPPLRLFSNLDEWLSDSAVDATVPFKTELPFTDLWSGLEAKFKTGIAYLVRDRNFEFRRFRTLSNGSTFLDFSLTPEAILQEQFYGIPGGLQFNEDTQKADSFQAKQDIAGIYGMFDLPIVEDRLRLIAGARVEYSYISTNGFTALQSKPTGSIINDLDPLPGINLVYSPIDDMNVRVGYSQTVSRPEFRELTPTQFPVPGGERTIIGNPDLVSAHITNYDLRWEWFLSGLNLVSASFFYKQLDQPIEKIAIGLTTQLADSFANADTGTIWGFEFEVRHDLGFIGSALRDVPYLRVVAPQLNNFAFSANATEAQSEVNITATSNITNKKRALQGQPDFVVNSSLEYSDETVGTLRLLYNTIGEQIAAAGVDGLPDIFAQRRDQLDFVWVRKFSPFGRPVSVKFTAENILNDQFIESQGEFSTERYTTGVKLGVGISYAY
jgi:outer membrane receptor protein involved in Fe transport